MTTTQYWIAKLAQAFGYNRKNHRMSDAASEMHLLREAEAYLGMRIWEKVEHIEALSVEYWSLRKLVEERQSASDRLAKNEEKLRIAHEERASLLNATPEFDQSLFEERNSMLAELERLAKERDDIVSNAREVRRAYAGMKMKLEVLSEEPNPNEHQLVEIEKTKIRLKDLKDRFESLKKQRIEIGQSIEEGDAKIDRIDEKLQESRQQRRILASDAFMAIGDGNKEISALRAETALVDTKIRHLYAEIGRYVSRNTPRNPECTAVCAENRGLVDVMRALRRSVALNHRLAGIT